MVLTKALAHAKYMPRTLRAFEIAQQLRCPVLLDKRNVIWIPRDGQWQVFERPWWESLR